MPRRSLLDLITGSDNRKFYSVYNVLGAIEVERRPRTDVSGAFKLVKFFQQEAGDDWHLGECVLDVKTIISDMLGKEHVKRYTFYKNCKPIPAYEVLAQLKVEDIEPLGDEKLVSEAWRALRFNPIAWKGEKGHVEAVIASPEDTPTVIVAVDPDALIDAAEKFEEALRKSGLRSSVILCLATKRGDVAVMDCKLVKSGSDIVEAAEDLISEFEKKLSEAAGGG